MDENAYKAESNGPAEANELLDLKHDDEKTDKVAELPHGKDLSLFILCFYFKSINSVIIKIHRLIWDRGRDERFHKLFSEIKV